MSEPGQPYQDQPYPGQQPGGYPQYGTPPPGGYPQYGAPPVPAGTYLDQESGLPLPQGTVLASRGRRVGAWFLSGVLGIVTLGIGYVIWSLIVWGRGQTPVYQVLGMRCLRPEDGSVAGWGRMALREIVGRFVEGLLSIITQVLSLVFFLTRADRRDLPDLIGGTIVVHDPDKVLAKRS